MVIIYFFFAVLLIFTVISIMLLKSSSDSLKALINEIKESREESKEFYAKMGSSITKLNCTIDSLSYSITSHFASLHKYKGIKKD